MQQLLPAGRDATAQEGAEARSLAAEWTTRAPESRKTMRVGGGCVRKDARRLWRNRTPQTAAADEWRRQVVQHTGKRFVPWCAPKGLARTCNSCVGVHVHCSEGAADWGNRLNNTPGFLPTRSATLGLRANAVGRAGERAALRANTTTRPAVARCAA